MNAWSLRAEKLLAWIPQPEHHTTDGEKTPHFKVIVSPEVHGPPSWKGSGTSPC